ncbi:nucleotidyltransferase domain-containing protein [Acidovorax sp. LjRoot66]|uniref:nucleotidyltransferase domain-containing protein n=1 Tax=Acidovorax sp. LjRoot66 TaxID=3342334 RepID=UPI003ECE6C53
MTAHHQPTGFTWTPLLRTFCNELVQDGGAHTVLLYGSRANGSEDQDSDCDIAAFAPREDTARDTRVVDGVFLDVFIYPESVLLQQPATEFLKLRQSVVLVQRAQQADRFLQGLQALFAQGPPALPADEARARRSWAWKMVARMERGDAEGHYRRAWLLTSLLEDYFALRGLWYEGPKKALQWLGEHDPTVAIALKSALQPGALSESIHHAVWLVAGDPPVTSPAAPSFPPRS